ncbi:DUF5412 domain-containing protein [Planococcus kocurii]|nr:DUF5412 domain-containing protein [Planococcus kocurii]
MKKGLVIGVASSIVIAALFGYVVYWAFFDMQRLPEGEFLTESVSPNGAYTIRAYVTNGGATVAYAIRGELVFNEENKKDENIYWNYREDSATIQWVDEDTVDINGHLLRVPKEKYDFRNEQ